MSAPRRYSDSKRLDALIGLQETGSSDFYKILYFAREKRKSEDKAYRLALDQYIEENDL